MSKRGVGEEDSFQVLKKPYELHDAITFFGRKFSNLTISKHGGIFFGLSDHDEVSDYFERLPALSSISDPPLIAVHHERVITNIGSVNVRHLTSDFQSDRQMMQLIHQIRENLADCPSQWMPAEVVLITWSNLVSRTDYSNQVFDKVNNFMAALLWDNRRTYYLADFSAMKQDQQQQQHSSKFMAGFNLGSGYGWLGVDKEYPVNTSLITTQYYYRLDRGVKSLERGSCHPMIDRNSVNLIGCSAKQTNFSVFPRRLSLLGGELVILQDLPCSRALLVGGRTDVFCNFVRQPFGSSSFQRKYRMEAFALRNPNKADFMACRTPSFQDPGMYTLTVTQGVDGSDCILGSKFSSSVVVNALDDREDLPRLSVEQSSQEPRMNIITKRKDTNDHLRFRLYRDDFHVTEMASRLNFSLHSLGNLRPIFTASVYARDLVSLDRYEIKGDLVCIASPQECSSLNYGLASVKDLDNNNATIWSDIIFVNLEQQQQSSTKNNNNNKSASTIPPNVNKANESFCTNNNQLRTLINEQGKIKSWFYPTTKISCPSLMTQALNDVVDFRQTDYCPLTIDQKCSQDQLCFDGRYSNVIVKCCYFKTTEQLVFTNELTTKSSRERIQPSVLFPMGEEPVEGLLSRSSLNQFWSSIIWPHYTCCLEDDSQLTKDNCESFWLSNSQYVSSRDYQPKRTGIAFGNGHVIPFDLTSTKKCHDDLDECLVANRFHSIDKFGDYTLVTDPLIQIRVLSLTSSTMSITGVAWRSSSNDAGHVCEINLLKNAGRVDCTCSSTVVHDEIDVDGMQVIRMNDVIRASTKLEYWVRFVDRQVGMLISTYSVEGETRLIIQISHDISKEIKEGDLGLLENHHPLIPRSNDKDRLEDSNGDRSVNGNGETKIDDHAKTIDQRNGDQYYFPRPIEVSLFQDSLDYRSLKFLHTGNTRYGNVAMASRAERIRDIKICQGSEFCLADRLTTSPWEGNVTRDLGHTLKEMVELGSKVYDFCDLPNLLGISTSISNENRSLGSQIHFHGCKLTEYRLELLKRSGIDINSEIVHDMAAGHKVWLPKNFSGENQVTCMKSLDGKQDWYPHNTVRKWQSICQGDRIISIRMFSFFGGFAYWMIIILFLFGLVIVVLLTALIMGFIKAPFNKKIAQKASTTIPHNFGVIPTCFASSDTSGSVLVTDPNMDDRGQSCYKNNLRYYNTGKYSPCITNSPVKAVNNQYIVPGVIYKGNLTSRPIKNNANSSGSDQTSRVSNQNSLSDIETESFNLWDQDSHPNQHHQPELVYVPTLNNNNNSQGIHLKLAQGLATPSTLSHPYPVFSSHSATLRPKNSNRVYLNVANGTGTMNPYQTSTRMNPNLGRGIRPNLHQNPYELFPIKTLSKPSKNPFHVTTSHQLVKGLYENQTMIASTFSRVSPIQANANDLFIMNNSLISDDRTLPNNSNDKDHTEFYPSKNTSAYILGRGDNPWQTEGTLETSGHHQQVSSFTKDEDDSLLLADFDVVIDGGRSDSGRKSKKAPIVVCTTNNNNNSNQLNKGGTTTQLDWHPKDPIA